MGPAKNKVVQALKRTRRTWSASRVLESDQEEESKTSERAQRNKSNLI